MRLGCQWGTLRGLARALKGAAIAWLCACLLAGWPLITLSQGLPQETLRFSEAEVAYGDGPTAPQQGWTRVRLPDVFEKRSDAGGRTGWYRLRFDMAGPPDEPLVLLVQRAVLTAEFRLNGSLLNPGVTFGQTDGTPGTQMLNWPHWMVLPPALFRPGRNELLIKLRGSEVIAPWISGISMGRPDALHGEFLLRDIPQRLIPQAEVVLVLASLIFGVRIWWREQLPLQGLVIVAMVLWLFTLILYLSPDIPLPWRTVDAMYCALWIAFHWALLNLLWRLSDGGWPWFPRALFIGSAGPLVGALLVLALQPQGNWLAPLMVPTSLLRCLTTLLMLRWAWRERSWSAVSLAACELLWFAGTIQLLLVVVGVLSPDPFMLSPASALPLYLAMLWQGAQRLAQRREEVALQRMQAVYEERQRMMADMHDGVGSQLVTALRLARREEVPRQDVAKVIQAAMNDLRLIIDARDGTSHELQSLLQQWVQHNQPQLAALGQRLQWAADDLPTPRHLSPLEALQVLRILQEALNNAVKHSGSATVNVTLKPVPGGCELSVCDEGSGIAAPRCEQFSGRGLTNMAQRAGRIGARLDVRPGEGRGTVVSLRLPDAA